MNKLTLMFAPLALVLMVGPLSAQPQGSTTILLTGFCDGMTLNVSGLLIGGTQNNYDCHGSTTVIGGNVSTDFLMQPRIFPDSRANVASELGPLLSGCQMNYYLDFASSKWANYKSCAGEPEILVNKGSFTISAGAPAHGRGTPSMVANGSAAGDTAVTDPILESGFPQGSFDISWGDFCDGMHVTTSGTALGATLTGCATGVAAGNNGRVDLSLANQGGSGLTKGANISSSKDSPCILTYNIFYAQLVWANWITCGGEIPVVLNQGTMTITTGAPPKFGTGGSSAARH
jgi:hypothetical protein